ncbi:apoptosis-inducing factor 3-like [Halichondria panicea]|uniref:apoptosis-inducing factor 3-like n=1 Tax=Halichondria panicea TaxID=6063 RepID=UPI00312B4D14
MGGTSSTISGSSTDPQPQAVADNMAEYVEAVVGKASEFGDNEMREVELGESKALVIKHDGQFSAIGHKCSHYGAPLIKGYLGNGRVRCPWHGACFNIKSGDIEDFPGLDGVPSFQVQVEGDDVVVKADKASLTNFRRTMTMCPADPQEDQRVFVCVGGGAASLECAETLRQEGFKGRIILATKESDLPYDRPKLSKALTFSGADLALRSADFYSSNNIEVLLSTEMTGLDLTQHSITFANGETQKYDNLLLATGSKPRSLPIPGFQLDNVFLLRDPAQGNKIAESAVGKNVVIIGTSFIGMEVAAYLSNKAASVACIDLTAVPFERVLGERVGKMLQTMHEEKGVKFYLGSGVKEIVGDEGKVTGVMLPSGETLEADVVVAGVGVVPATEFLKDSGVPMTPRGEVIVDKHMMATDGVFAAGDIARFHLPLINGDTNIGHWQLAHNHGRVAARNMLGREEEFNSIPYFWTVQYGKSVRYCGHALSWDEIIYNGSPEENKFAAFYVKDDKVMAVSSLNFDPVVSQCAELMYQGRMPSGAQLRDNPDVAAYI